MKIIVKTTFIICIVFSFFVSLFLYNQYTENKLYFYNIKNSSDYYLQKSSKFDDVTKLNKLALENEVNIIVTVYNDKFEEKYIMNKNEIVIKNNEFNKITLNKGKVNGFINKNINLRYFSLDKLDISKYPSFSLKVIGEQVNINNFTENSIITSSYEINQTTFDNNRIFDIGLILILFIVLCVQLFSYYFSLVVNTKSLGILKLLGYKKKDYFYILAKSQFVFFMRSSLIVFIFLFIIFVHDFSFYGMMFIIINIFIQIINVMFLYIVYIVFIKKTYYNSTLDALKGKESINGLYSVNRVIIFIVTVVLIITMNGTLQTLNKVIKYNNTSLKKWKEINDYSLMPYFSGASESEVNSKKTDEKLDNLYKTTSKNGVLFSDFRGYTNPDNNGIEAAEINEYYLKLNKVYDINNNLINITKVSKRTYLMPVNKKNDAKKIIDNEDDGRGYNIIYLKADQEFFTYNFDINNTGNDYIKNPIVAIYPDNHPNNLIAVNSVSNYNFFVKDSSLLKKSIKKLKLSNMIEDIYTVEGYTGDEMKVTYDKLRILSIISVLSLFTISIVIMQNANQFAIVNKEKLAVQSLLGFKYYDKYKAYYTMFYVAITLGVLSCLVIYKLDGLWLLFISSFVLCALILGYGNFIFTKYIDEKVIKNIKNGD